MTAENDELEELAKEVRRLIKSNEDFLKHVNDEEYDADDEGEETADGSAEEMEDFEEL